MGKKPVKEPQNWNHDERENFRKLSGAKDTKISSPQIQMDKHDEIFGFWEFSDFEKYFDIFLRFFFGFFWGVQKKICRS